MNRFFCFLGVLGLLAGASLVLPATASAQPVACSSNQAGTAFAIAEIPAFQITGTEQYQCAISPFGAFFGDFDLTEPTAAPFPHQTNPVSDHVAFAAGGGGIVVTLTSDTNGLGLTSTSGTAVPEAIIACPTAQGFGPDPANEDPSHCYGVAGHELIALGGVDTGVQLTVYSDLAAVPEPSTGLLLGAALPALIGLRRRSMRVSA